MRAEYNDAVRVHKTKVIGEKSVSDLVRLLFLFKKKKEKLFCFFEGSTVELRGKI